MQLSTVYLDHTPGCSSLGFQAFVNHVACGLIYGQTPKFTKTFTVFLVPLPNI